MNRLFTIAGLLLLSLPVTAQPELSKDNIDEVLKAMTLEEKAALCVGGGWGSMSAGSMTASSMVFVPGAAGTTRAIPRLGIPSTVLSDGPAGLRINPTRPGTDHTFYCTGFPVGTAYASSWDVDLIGEMGRAMGNEVLEYGVDVLLAPGMNLHRNPLCGRNFEYYSEDPFLSGKVSAAFVKGVQSNGVGVSLKHFAGNNQEVNRTSNNAVIDVRALRELYLKNFEIAVREADPWTVMSSYNKVNGSFTQQSADLLTKILREEWGFKGIVMTDWGTKDGTVDAVNAGNDLMEPGADVEIQRIVEGVRNGSIKEADLDRNVRRLLEYIVKTPRFNRYKYSDSPDLKAHAAIARKTATESMVLLKNDNGALPMTERNIALYGISSVDFVAGGTGSGNVNKPYVINLREGLENAGFRLAGELVKYYESYIAYADAKAALNPGQGSGVLLGEAKKEEVAIPRTTIDRLSVSTEAAVIVIGRNAGEGADRNFADFNISDVERKLISDVCDAYHAAGKKVTVVLNMGGVIETYSWKNLPDAILCAWQPGEEGGNAVADVLTGKVNPSGKLTMTFPRQYMDIPGATDFPYNYVASNRQFGGRGPVKNVDVTTYSEGIFMGYRYFDTKGVEVSYPFGFGLSYTSFSYSSPKVRATRDGGFVATVTVKNTGKVAGKEIVELYVSAPSGGLDKPAKELKAFAKTALLAPGESQTLSMEVSNYDLASFNPENNRWETASGTYRIHFARNISDIQCTSAYRIGSMKTYSVTEAYRD